MHLRKLVSLADNVAISREARARARRARPYHDGDDVRRQANALYRVHGDVVPPRLCARHHHYRRASLDIWGEDCERDVLQREAP
eukprot:4101218-Prymnesium_polylepis.1